MPSNKDSVTTYEKPALAAASLRAPLRGEVHAIDVTTTSKRIGVLDAWKGCLVRVQAETADVGVQVSLANDATADLAARSTLAAADGNGVQVITAAPANGCFRVPAGQWLDIPIPATALTIALVGSAAGAARLHLSET